jgi:transposase InsO family protein
VRGAFIIDAHDREIIAWCAIVNAGIAGSDVRDMMLAAVETRFGAHRAPHQIEMLTDNGSPYIAKETRVFARQLGLKPCYTPVKSPQSNGISEAFVNTLKRDYVNITPLPDAATVLGLISGWFEDYRAPRFLTIFAGAQRCVWREAGVRLSVGGLAAGDGHGAAPFTPVFPALRPICSLVCPVFTPGTG